MWAQSSEINLRFLIPYFDKYPNLDDKELFISDFLIFFF